MGLKQTGLRETQGGSLRLEGTHNGLGSKHPPHHLDEFVLRFNRRNSPMAAFQPRLGLTGQYQPTTYKTLSPLHDCQFSALMR